MTTIQDRIEILKNIFFANGVKCDNEQFLIEDINNLIKEVEEEKVEERRHKQLIKTIKSLTPIKQ